MVKGMGGAMDLAVGAKRVVVMMDHASKDGKSKVLRECGLPLTGKRCVNAICTDYAWMDVTKDGLLVRELAPGVTFEALQELTDPKKGLKLIKGPELKTMAL
jgi:3-oxoacid CoA-transferase subunit B